MVQFEYFPAVIDAHRNDLRALAHPRSREVAPSSLRRAIGHRLIQVGRWVEGNRAAIAGESLPTLGEPTGAA